MFLMFYCQAYAKPSFSIINNSISGQSQYQPTIYIPFLSVNRLHLVFLCENRASH